MRRRLWFLLVEFLAITLPLAWLWDAWGRGMYLNWFETSARPFLDLLGAERVPRGGSSIGSLPGNSTAIGDAAFPVRL